MQPLHTASINGDDVRFFADPVHKADEPPWVVFSELHRAMGLPASDLERCVECLYLLPTGEGRAYVNTDHDMVMIVPHWVAYSFTAGLVSSGQSKLSMAASYGEALGEAIDRLLDNSSPGERRRQKQRWLAESFGIENFSAP